jgi:hypothetical protein
MNSNSFPSTEYIQWYHYVSKETLVHLRSHSSPSDRVDLARIQRSSKSRSSNFIDLLIMTKFVPEAVATLRAIVSLLLAVNDVLCSSKHMVLNVDFGSLVITS